MEIPLDQLVEKIGTETDIVASANLLLNFVQRVRKEPSSAEKTRLLDELYLKFTVLLQFALRDSFFNNTKYCVLDDLGSFIQINAPRRGTPNETLDLLEAYANKAVDSFTAPANKAITCTRVTEIIDYLNEKYQFAQKVFGGSIAHIFIVNASEKTKDGAFATQNTLLGTVPIFFLYANRKECSSIAPECVFFHELGHAIHLHITGSLDVMPVPIMEFLDKTWFAGIAAAPLVDQQEVLADVFAAGLMHNSPFADCSRYNFMEEQAKEVFSLLVSKVV